MYIIDLWDFSYQIKCLLSVLCNSCHEKSTSKLFFLPEFTSLYAPSIVPFDIRQKKYSEKEEEIWWIIENEKLVCGIDFA